MQSLQDLHLFDDDQNFQKQKEESINELIKDEEGIVRLPVLYRDRKGV